MTLIGLTRSCHIYTMGLRNGSKIANTKFEYLDEGAYGTVFVDRAAKRICKIYRFDGRPESHCRLVFQSEWQALVIASQSPDLSPLIMSPISRRQNYKIISADGSDITADFLTDAAFEGALIEGRFFKIGAVLPSNKEEVRSAFRLLDIRHLNDASVLIGADGAIERIIDFGMRDIELEA